MLWLVRSSNDVAPADRAQHAAAAAVSAATAPTRLNATSAASPESSAATTATASAPLPVVTIDSSRSTAHKVGESSLLCAAAYPESGTRAANASSAAEASATGSFAGKPR